MQVVPILYTVQEVSERRFIDVLGVVRLHRWSCIVVRHGGHVHRDVFCSLLLWFAASLSLSRICSSLPLVPFFPIFWVTRVI